MAGSGKVVAREGWRTNRCLTGQGRGVATSTGVRPAGTASTSRARASSTSNVAEPSLLSSSSSMSSVSQQDLASLGGAVA